MTTATNLDGFAHISSSANNAQETELSSRLNDCIEPSVPLHLLMKNVVDVFVMVLQDDGAVFPACVIAASLALADSGVETYGLVTAFSVAVIPRQVITNVGGYGDGDVGMEDDEDDQGISKSDSNYRLLADPSTKEVLVADAVLTVAMMKSWKEVVFWDQAGSLPPSVANEASDLCQEGCIAMHNFMRQALVG
jgi:ribonuclease PH